MKTQTPRPMWARHMARYKWEHVQESQPGIDPTLAILRINARNCSECRQILGDMELTWKLAIDYPCPSNKHNWPPKVLTVNQRWSLEEQHQLAIETQMDADDC